MTGPSSVQPRRPGDMLLLYATHDGQAGKIAYRISLRLAEHGISAPPRDLAIAAPAPAELATAPLIAVIAAVRYGRHLQAAERLLAGYRNSRSRAPLVFLSVNLTARKPGRDSVQTNRYLRKSLARHRLTPAFAAAVAGRLDYPRYGWMDRQIIRLIMKLTGGPTDPQTCTEFTDWHAVDTIARRIAERLERCGETRPEHDESADCRMLIC